MRRNTVAFLVLLGSLTGCQDDEFTTAPDFGEISPVISDGPRGGSAGFAFLPPMLPATAPTGPFDPELSPVVIICELRGSTCRLPVLAQYTMNGTESERVRISEEEQHYTVNWHTRGFNLHPAKTYRVSVGAVGLPLGHADVKVVESARDLRNIDASQYVGVVNGSTLPIKFRVEKHALLAPGDDALVAQARALLSASNPAGAYQSFLLRLMEIYSTSDAETAHRRIQAISAFAFDRIEDREALAALQIQLGGRSYEIGTGGPSASSAPSSANFSVASTGASDSKTTVIYVNGVNTDEITAAEGAVEVHQMTYEIGWRFYGADAKYKMRFFYNPSAAHTTTPDFYCWAAKALGGFGSIGANLTLNLFQAAANCDYVLGDLVEAARQIANLANFQPGGASATASALADVIRQERVDGNKVLLVGHSQGNLMINEAISLVEDRTCVGVVSVAAPTSIGWPIDVAKREAVITEGVVTEDILLWLDLNPTDRRTETPLSKAYDRNMIQDPDPVAEAMYNLDLHSFFNYTSDALGVRDDVQQMMQAVSDELAGCEIKVEVTPEKLSVRKDQTGQLTASVTDSQGNPLPEVNVSWISRDPGIASVSANGLGASVTGVAEGTTWIIAESEGVKDSAEVTVRAVSISFRVLPAAAIIRKGHNMELIVDARDSEGNSATLDELRWISRNTAVASVVGGKLNAIVAGHKYGSTWIIAESEEAIDSVKVIVGGQVFYRDPPEGLIWSGDSSCPGALWTFVCTYEYYMLADHVYTVPVSESFVSWYRIMTFRQRYISKTGEVIVDQSWSDSSPSSFSPPQVIEDPNADLSTLPPGIYYLPSKAEMWIIGPQVRMLFREIL